MLRSITYQQTLFYYDVPMIFYGTDAIGCVYFFLLTNDQKDNLEYVCTPISKTRLKEFNKGIIDLRTIFIEPEIKEFYKCKVEIFDGSNLNIDFFTSEDLPVSMLPEKGFYLNVKDETMDEIVEKAKEFNKPILYASLDPPESQFETKILADRLSNFLINFQNLVKYAYKKTCKYASSNVVSFDPEDAYKLQVIGVGGGSFTVKLEPLESGDIFGSCGVEQSFEKIDEIVSAISDLEESLRILKLNKGHLVRAYIRLLKFISENNTSLEYRWATPIFDKSKRNRISQKDAKPLLEYLNKKEDISTETVEFLGSFIGADKKSTNWKFLNDEDRKEYTGKVKDGTGITLEGVVIGSVKYRLICEEIIEEVLGTGKEMKTLWLIKLSPFSV